MVSEQRQQAFLDSMEGHSLPVDEDLLANGFYVADSAKYHVPNFLAAGATAILCGNDLLAYGTIEECRSRGFRVPEDISVIGFDDLPTSPTFAPPLTTVRQDRIELGKSGYYTLNSLVHHVSISKTLLRPQFIVRDSTTTAPRRREKKESTL